MCCTNPSSSSSKMATLKQSYIYIIWKSLFLSQLRVGFVFSCSRVLLVASCLNISTPSGLYLKKKKKKE